MAVKERLKDYIKHRGISISAFCEAIGVSVAYVNSMRRSIQPDKIERIALKFPDLNTEWLMTGNGEMLKISQNSIKNSESLHYINVLPLSAAGGPLNDFVMSVKDYDCEKIPTPIEGAEIAIPIAGNSMYSKYPEGTIVFAKKINEMAFLEYGEVYVLSTCNGTIVKVVNKGNDEKHIKCSSLNPDQVRYQPFEIPVECVYGFYKVLGSLSRS